jgi:hypothetical protein
VDKTADQAFEFFRFEITGIEGDLAHSTTILTLAGSLPLVS